MRIRALRHETSGARARVSAEVQWEESARPPQEIYFEASAPFADGLTRTPDAFLAAAVVPAMRHGERRVAVEDPVCPELREGLHAVMCWLHEWFGEPYRPIAVEGPTETHPSPARAPDRAACFFTGGVDSMAVLRQNRTSVALEHPSSFRDAIVIYGLEVERPEAFDRVLESLSVVAADAAITLLPVATNVRSLDADWIFWEFQWQSGVYASVAHALSRRITSAAVSSTYHVATMSPYGSHPLLDSHYGSARLRVRHQGMTLSRLDKLRLLAGWPVGLDRLRVCNRPDDYRPDTINCGRCEKCIRTMLGLAAIGALDQSRAFVPWELTPEAVVERGHIHTPYLEGCYRELLEPLAEHGRTDLARAVQYLLDKHRGELGWHGSLRRFDRQRLGGRLRMVKRLLEPGPAVR